MKQFHCGDVVPGCTARFQADDESGILAQVAAHAQTEHGMVAVPPALVEQVRSRIVEVTA